MSAGAAVSFRPPTPNRNAKVSASRLANTANQPRTQGDRAGEGSAANMEPAVEKHHEPRTPAPLLLGKVVDISLVVSLTGARLADNRFVAEPAGSRLKENEQLEFRVA